MPGKVFHISDDVHAAVTLFCAERSIARKKWVDRVLTEALRRGDSGIRTEATPVETPVLMPVAKKDVPVQEFNTGAEPWTLAPFWQQKPQQEPT